MKMLRHNVAEIRLCVVLFVGLLATGSASAQGALEQMLYNFQQSEFEFGRSDSIVPYPPLSWVSYTHYSDTELQGEGPLAGESFQQDEFSQALMLPVYISTKDLVALGEYVGYSRFDFDNPDRASEDLYTLGLVAGWMRQVNPRSQVSAFAAPFVISELGGADPEGVEFYGGGVGLYRQNDTFTWLYGGVYEHSFGDNFIYPYAGFIWTPRYDLSLSFVAPWPSVTYAASSKWLLRLGFFPAGSTWSLDEQGKEANLEFGSWNLMAMSEYRITRNLWLSFGVGAAGFRGFQIDTGGETDMEVDVDSDPIFSVALNFRPPGGLARDDR